MSPLIKNKSNLPVCSITVSGIGMKTAVVKQANWKFGDRIGIYFIEKAKCILLRHTDNDDSFKLSYSDSKNKTGGKINCKAFTCKVGEEVGLPKKNLVPVFTNGADWTVALFLEKLDWVTEEFSKSGVNTVQKNVVGIYELMGKAEAVLRIGEGIIKDRINAHLKDKRFSHPTVKTFRYLALDDANESKILEKVLIAEFERDIGVLPRFQEIRA